MNANDRRVKKTKKALQQALAKLMTQKELRNITVQELADMADVHRATFYTHYHDVYDLYEQIENEILAGFESLMEEDPVHTYEEFFGMMLHYIYQNAIFFRMLLGKNGENGFHSRIYTLIEENYLEIWQLERKQVEITEEMRYLAVYHIQGCMAIIVRWLEGDLTYPKGRLTELIIALDNSMDALVNRMHN